MKQGTIVKSFKKCGISSALYHTENSVLFVKSGSLDNNNNNGVMILWNFMTSSKFILHCHLFD